ncbi:hypothetical protein [Enterococcus hulanensis]|nr:hypothetical protein [Enterococcus hulanensis]
MTNQTKRKVIIGFLTAALFISGGILAVITIHQIKNWLTLK